MIHNISSRATARRPRSRARIFLIGALLAGTASPLLAAASPAQAAAKATTFSFNIASQDMESALLTFARTANVQMVVDTRTLKGLTAPAVAGRYTPAEALAHLLHSSTLDYAWAGPNTLTIKPRRTKQPVSQRFETRSSAVAAANEAQEAGKDYGAGVDEILVTARRSSERLIDVPVAVSALSSEALVRNNITNLSRLAEIVPFVNLTPALAGSGGLFAIRGIGSPPADPGIQQSVLVNIDNVMIGRGRAALAGLYDLSQIEVLKGPQALFFGKNAPAGVVSLTTADPGNALAGFVRAGYEFKADERYVEGALGGPVTDTLRVRVAARYSFIDGYIRNVAKPGSYPTTPATFAPWIAAGATIPGAATARLPHGSDWGARITAIWSPSSSFTAKIKYSYGDNQVTNNYNPFCTRGVTSITTSGVADPQSDCKFDTRLAVSAQPSILVANMPWARDGAPYGDLKTHIVSFNADWDVSDTLSLAAITGYYKLNNANANSLGNSAIPAFYLIAKERSSAISQELRLTSKFDAPANFVVGAYIDKTKQYNGNSAIVRIGAVDPATGKYYSFDRFSRFIAKSYSVFGQLRLDLMDNLELAGGARYTHETRDSVDGNSYVNPNAAALNLRAAGNYFVRSLKDSNWSPEATLTWHPSPDQTLYGAFKTGYKSGGFSYPTVLSGVAFTSANTTFKPERSRGFEVGYKAQLLDRRLTVQATAYTTTFSDQQVSAFNQSTGSYTVGNAAKSRVKGVELQAVAAPFQGLQLRGNIGYNDAKYVSYVNGPCPGGLAATLNCVGAGGSRDLSGYRLPRAPKWQGNAGFTYETVVADGFKLEFNGDTFYSARYLLEDNVDPTDVQKAFWKFNAGISVGPEDDKWTISLVGRNLTNKLVATYAIGMFGASAGNVAGVPERPREIAIEGRFNF